MGTTLVRLSERYMEAAARNATNASPQADTPRTHPRMSPWARARKRSPPNAKYMRTRAGSARMSAP